MNASRWIGVITVLVVLASGVADSRPTRPASALAASMIPGTSVPDVHLGQAPQQPPASLSDLTFDNGSLNKTQKILPVLDKLFRIDRLERAVAGRGVTAGIASSLPNDIASLVETKHLHLDDAGRVQVWVDASGTTGEGRADVEALGGDVQTIDDKNGIVQALVPVSQLSALSALSSVKNVRLPAYGSTDTGSVTTEGDTILNAATLRASLGATGNGVRIGVISDGFEGMSASQASGDLPSVVDTSTCNVSPGITSPMVSGAGAEGTAMAEIIHDIAPKAQIFAGYWGLNTGGTGLDFNNAVNCLAAHTDIVVDDISFVNVGPYDGTSMISANTAAALANDANPIRGYYTANGNEADVHYRAAWSDSGYLVGNYPAGDWWEIHRFAAGGGTTDGGFGLGCAPAPAPFCGDAITLGPGGSASVLLEWNEPFGSASSDYDLLTVNYTTSTLSVASNARQGPSYPYPTEEFSVTNSTASPVGYGILIGNYKNLAPARTFDMFIECHGCYAYPTGLPAPDDYARHNFNTLAGSVPNQSDSGAGVVSVGAIGASDSPGYNTIEWYSGRGPTTDGRTKPDVTGIDCVGITGNGGFATPFCGTSAAAPHVAAIAALLLHCDSALLAGSGFGTPAGNRTALRNAILNSAVDLGAPGVDNVFGHGRIDAVSAANALGCAPVDTDGDGCADVKEPLLVPPTDPNNPWDFYNVPLPALFAAADPTAAVKDHAVSAGDAQAVFAYFKAAAVAGTTVYDQDLNKNGVADGIEYDRTYAGPGQTGPPDGVISAQDAQMAFAQFKEHYSC